MRKARRMRRAVGQRRRRRRPKQLAPLRHVGVPRHLCPQMRLALILSSTFSDALDEQSGEESDDGSEEENEADAATDPSRSIELGGRLAAYVKALRESLGEQQFGALCATLTSPEEPGGRARGALIRSMRARRIFYTKCSRRRTICHVDARDSCDLRLLSRAPAKTWASSRV